MSITGEIFITHIKAKLNRLDSAAYEDIQPEEVLLFANDALKNLILQFDLGQFSHIVDVLATKKYLATLYSSTGELPLTYSKVTVPDCLKLRNVEVYVEIEDEKGWVPGRDKDHINFTGLKESPFLRSFADNPIFRLIDGDILFEAPDFNCTKMRSDLLITPLEITEDSILTYPFIPELENKTVTLLLENLEGRRLNSQPVVSKS